MKKHVGMLRLLSLLFLFVFILYPTITTSFYNFSCFSYLLLLFHTDSKIFQRQELLEVAQVLDKYRAAEWHGQ